LRAPPPKPLHFRGRDASAPITGDDDTMGDENLISKTRRKRQMLDLQKVGVALAELRTDQLARLEMPEDLRKAILERRAMTKHEAIRRQMQYVGKLMRKLDAAPIIAQLEAMHAPSHQQTALFHRAERWRTEMMAEGDAIARFVAEFPDANAEHLRELSLAAVEERRAERTPKRYRELFQAINTILQDHGKRHP
jgi:ribosome-associated protein